jgi:hypothetical protein
LLKRPSWEAVGAGASCRCVGQTASGPPPGGPRRVPGPGRQVLRRAQPAAPGSAPAPDRAGGGRPPPWREP